MHYGYKMVVVKESLSFLFSNFTIAIPTLFKYHSHRIKEWMKGWRDERMEGWRHGGMEGWRDGGMEGWRAGGMEGWSKRTKVY